jgi:hypothetical protein
VATPSDSTCYSYDFGDIDGDGDLDLLGANGAPSGSVAEILLKNDGTGTYTNATSQLLFNPGVDDNDSKFFDYDNDGDLDLIIGVLGSAAERIYNNNGLGTFSSTSGVISGQTDSTLDVMVADLTGNGAYDIVTAQGESSNFQNRIYVNNGPADTLPPTIVDTETQGDTGDAAGPYVIRAAILDHMTSDRNFFDKGITLNYQINFGATQTVPMRHSGGQIYRGELPGQPMGSVVKYWVTAIDFNDNEGEGASQTFQVILPGYPFDDDDDGDVDLANYVDFLSCMDGPHNDHAGTSPCLIHDADGDYNVDLSDAAAFQRDFTG